MRVNLFMYCTVGRRAELERGRAGQDPALYQRMLDEIATYVSLADDAGFAGFGHPEHHLQIEGFEESNDPRLMGMWIGAHSRRLRVITCGFVSTTHNPLRTAEDIATMDHMLRGRFGVGLVRGYQARWVENFKARPELAAVGPWNKDTPTDDYNRQYFAEFVDIVVTALTQPTIRYQGKFWSFPPDGFVNPHRHDVYVRHGAGVGDDMAIHEVGIAPRPLQQPHPPLYGGFTASMRTAVYWARYNGKPIVLASDLDFCATLWSKYREAAAGWGHDVVPGEEAAWGGLCVVAPTDAEAREWAEDFRWFWRTWSTPFGQPEPELLIGSPDTVSARIDQARERFPIEELFLLIPQGVLPPEKVRATLELLGDKVLPRFS